MAVVLAASAAGAMVSDGRNAKPANAKADAKAKPDAKPVAKPEPRPGTCGGEPGGKKASGGCGCSAGDLDPVLDPKYNVVQAVKQSILLEEHLSVARKRCADCITKHFLHVVGLLEEAVTLPGASAEECNAWCATAKAYDALWARWREGAAPDETAAGCRRLRKELVLRYVNVNVYEVRASPGENIAGATRCGANG